MTTLLCGIVAYLLAQVIGDGEGMAMLHDALILLVFFELMAFVFNILPVPGLDGFAALKPWLPARLTRSVSPKVGGIVTLAMLAIVFFWGYRIILPVMGLIAGLTGMDLSAVWRAFQRFHFWPGA